MKHPNAVYYGLLIALILFNFLIYVTPLLGMGGYAIAPTLYLGFSATCHQLDSRSLCVYPGGPHDFFHISSCTPETGTLELGKHDVVVSQYGTGYKLPVCSRDVSIYLAMLVGTIIFPFFYRLDSKCLPDKWLLIAAAIPIGLDGGIQFLSDIGLAPFMYESTNLIRLITGGLIGIVIPFFLIPILNIIYSSITSKSAGGEEKGRPVRQAGRAKPGHARGSHPKKAR
ncbi:MAG: DUF2085 domain-containing protein [Candidatus Micrarchaeia archaeon]